MRRITLHLIVAAVAAATLLSLLPTAASARPGMEIGLQDDAVFLNRTYYDRELGYRQAKELGVTRLRVNVLWSRVLGQQAYARKAPKVLSYDFSALDSMVDSAAAHGIKVQMTLTGPAPAWATKNRKVGPYKPRAPRYAAFVRAVAKHFRGRVDRYSIWNEPNWPGWLVPQKQCSRGRCLLKAAQLYRNLYIAGYRSIKRIDPRAQVMIGELAPEARPGKSIAPLTFIRKVASVRGRALRTDGFAHHPYAFKGAPTRRARGRNDVTMSSLGRLTRELRKLNRQRRLRGPHGRPPYLYLTEYGYFARGPRALPEGRRARFLAQGFDMGLRHPRVKQVLQYQLVGPPASDPWDTSLIAASGWQQLPFHSLLHWARVATARGSVATAR